MATNIYIIYIYIYICHRYCWHSCAFIGIHRSISIRGFGARVTHKRPQSLTQAPTHPPSAAQVQCFGTCTPRRPPRDSQDTLILQHRRSVLAHGPPRGPQGPPGGSRGALILLHSYSVSALSLFGFWSVFPCKSRSMVLISSVEQSSGLYKHHVPGTICKNQQNLPKREMAPNQTYNSKK